MVSPMPKIRPIRRSFFVRSVHEVAPELIGTTLLFKGVGGIIVEVEAYHHTDPAAHNARSPGDSPFELSAPTEKSGFAVGPRIGITKAMYHPWRYGLRGSPFLSKPFKDRRQ